MCRARIPLVVTSMLHRRRTSHRPASTCVPRRAKAAGSGKELRGTQGTGPTKWGIMAADIDGRRHTVTAAGTVLELEKASGGWSEAQSGIPAFRCASCGLRSILRRKMDCRVKPGNDGGECIDFVGTCTCWLHYIAACVTKRRAQ